MRRREPDWLRRKRIRAEHARLDRRIAEREREREDEEERRRQEWRAARAALTPEQLAQVQELERIADRNAARELEDRRQREDRRLRERNDPFSTYGT